MTADASLRLFAHHAARAEADLDLPRTALLLAEPEYPGLDVAAYLERIDELARLTRARLIGARDARGDHEGGVEPRVAQLLQFLYGELGFSGDHEDYYDPRNSFLNEVLDRRRGIPITLALVVLEVARRSGLTAHGIGFPGHFLVRFDDERRGFTFVDPFEGQVLDDKALGELAARHTGRSTLLDARSLEPATKANTLIRMLNNLRGIYSAKEDSLRLRGILERLEVLAPSSELRRQIEALGGTLSPPPRGRATPLHLVGRSCPRCGAMWK
jgi:regulator of sirC expression with transglutaminase-like and TPR domain